MWLHHLMILGFTWSDHLTTMLATLESKIQASKWVTRPGTRAALLAVIGGVLHLAFSNWRPDVLKTSNRTSTRSRQISGRRVRELRAQMSVILNIDTGTIVHGTTH
jgi:hypothetical protein